MKGLRVDRRNQVWAVDITCLPMRRGFLYRVAIMDWFTRKVLAWRISNTLEADFCVEALNEAVHKFGPPEIMNSDSHTIGASSRPSRGRTGCDGWASASLWTARDGSSTTSSSSDCGGRSNRSAFTCTPGRPGHRPAPAFENGWSSTTGRDRIPPLAASRLS